MFVTWNCTKTNFNNSRLKKFFIDIIIVIYDAIVSSDLRQFSEG